MSEPGSPSRRRLTAVAVVLLVIGVALAGLGAWQTGRTSASFGWFAYAPLSEATLSISSVPPWRPFVCIGVGALMAGFGGGILVGRRAR